MNYASWFIITMLRVFSQAVFVLGQKEIILRQDTSLGVSECTGNGPPDEALTSVAKLFEPLALRGVTLKNRIMVSPMSMYSSSDGFANDLHLVHLGRFALGGAGTVMVEATAVAQQGRGTVGCNGIWRDEHVPNLQRISGFLRTFGCTAGIQLGHSGPKGSSQRPWHGNGPLTTRDAAERHEQSWPVVSSTDAPFDAGWSAPVALTEADIDALVFDYRMAARRACQAGFQIVELHCAHGYLLHSFLSPLVNKRIDRYGGTIENRMRLPLRVVDALRDEIPETMPLCVRISAVDGNNVGWSMADSVVFAKQLALRGVDAIACSSGGIKLEKGRNLVSRIPGFQVPFAEQIKREAGVHTIAVGMILTPEQAEGVLRTEQADIVALGREMLFNPNWPAQAALALKGAEGWDEWPEQFKWWLQRRARQLAPRVT